MKASLDRVMRHLGSPAVETVASVFDRWPDLVGEQVASRARPVSLRDGVLVVGVDDPAWATQIRFLEAQVLAGIAAELGPDEVVRIEVRVRPGRTR
jgi:predicted nucleic acid-binding Zn ribbon protein